MGQSTSGDFQIDCQSEKDAQKICNKLNNIKALTEERTNFPAHFEFDNLYVEDTYIHCNVSSDRVQNGEFQIEEVIKLVKLMVENKEVEPPNEMRAELLVQHEGWFLDESDFSLGLDN